MVLPGRGISWKEFALSLKEEYVRDRISDVAGALAFSGILALFPFLLFLISLAGLIIDPQQAKSLVDQIAGIAPADVTKIVGERIAALTQDKSLGILTFGGLLALWAAAGGIASLTTALNTAYGVPDGRPFWKVRGLAILMTLVAAAIALVAVLLAVATPSISHFLGEPWAMMIKWLRLPVAGLLMMFLWALLYYFLPDVEQEFKFITPGSVFGVLLWLLASWGFSFYVGSFGEYEATYGTLGGVIVLLLWMWISAQVLLIGAEINAILEHKSAEGKAPGKKTMDQTGPKATKTEVEAAQGKAFPGPTPLDEGHLQTK